jgi:hypothetical protein
MSNGVNHFVSTGIIALAELELLVKDEEPSVEEEVSWEVVIEEVSLEKGAELSSTEEGKVQPMSIKTKIENK